MHNLFHDRNTRVFIKGIWIYYENVNLCFNFVHLNILDEGLLVWLTCA